MNAHSRDTIIPPTNIEVEQLVIGSVLLKNAHYYTVKSIIQAKYFSEQIHKNIWEILSDMIESDKVASPITIKDYLPDQITQDVSMKSYLASLAAEAMPHNIVSFAEVIRELYIRRYAITESELVMKECLNPRHDVSMYEILGDWSSSIAKLTDLLKGGIKSQSLHSAMADQVDRTAEAFQNGKSSGYDVGLRAVTDLTGPWLPGQYIIIGAATKSGKSGLALQTALKIAEQKPVLYFSFEMNSEFLAGRKLASMTRVGTIRQRTGNISEDEYEKLDRASKNIESAKNLYVVSQKLNITEIRQYCREFKLQHGELGAVYVDHLGILAKPQDMRTGKDWEIASNASPEMKGIAEELDCVCVGLSQLNKADGMWGLKTMKSKLDAALRNPNAGDLLGAIANDADHVIMPFRAEMRLNKIEPPSDPVTEDRLAWETVFDQHKGLAQIVLAVSRESEWPRKRDCIFDGPATEFKDIQNGRMV